MYLSLRSTNKVNYTDIYMYVKTVCYGGFFVNKIHSFKSFVTVTLMQYAICKVSSHWSSQITFGYWYHGLQTSENTDKC